MIRRVSRRRGGGSPAGSSGWVRVAGDWSVNASRTGLWLAGLFLFCFFYFLPRAGDWNQNARLDLTLALVNHHRIAIDGYQWNTGQDSVYSHGHWYMNKAPGQSYLGVPVYVALRAALEATGNRSAANQIGLARFWHADYRYFYVLQCLETMYTVAFPSALFLLLFFWFLVYLTPSLRTRVTLTLALGFGTNVFAYSQVFYAHVPAAALLFGAFLILFAVSHVDPANRRLSRWLTSHQHAALLVAGLALGLAIFYDHTSAILAGFIVLYALVSVRLRMLPFLIAGAAPLLAFTGLYDLAAYHNAVVTGYNTTGPGIGGSDSSWPPAGYGLFGLSFSPYRGLFFLSPFLLLAFPGAALWAHKGGREWALCMAAPACFFLAISTVSYWHGGVAAGPRYLIPMLPFLALPVVFILDAARSVAARIAVYGLIAVSMAVSWIETIGGKGYPPVSIHSPLFTYSFPALAHGRLPLSLGTILTAPIVGLNSIWSLAPLGLLLLGWFWYCFRPKRMPEPLAAAADTAA